MKLQFDIDTFSRVKDVESEQYAVVEIYIVSAGNNRHNMPISLSTIKKAAKTLKNKYLVAGFDGSDFEGHEPDEMIVGHFPESGKISYKQKDGKTYLVAEAVMSKIYANWAYQEFIEKNHRGVSMEISVTKTKDRDDGLTEIAEFVFNGVTILGDTHTPAIDGADITVTKFEVQDANDFYSKYSWKSNMIIQNYVDSMRNETGKEGTNDMTDTEETVVTEVVDEVSDTSIETVEETQPEAEVSTEAEQEFTEEDKTEDDDQATMEDDKDDDKDDEDDKDEDDDADSDDKSFESLTVEQKYEVFRAACKDSHLGYLESYDDEYLYCYDYNEGYTYRYSYTLDGTTCTIGDDKVRVMHGGYVPFEAETGEAVDTQEPVEAEDVANPEVKALQEENAELKKTIADYEAKEKENEVESILAGVVDVLSSDQISELREESKDFSLDNISEFSNKVKALAFESVKGKDNKYSFAKVALNSSVEISQTGKYSW